MLKLADVIEQLRAELTLALAAGQDQALRFEVGPVQLELTVAVESEAGGKGGIRFWVLELGAEGRRQAADTQTLRLTLEPKLASTGEPPTITGKSMPGER
jgi:hypothetical protein